MRAKTVGKGPFKAAIQHEGITYVLGITDYADEDKACEFAQNLVDQWNKHITDELFRYGFVKEETL